MFDIAVIGGGINGCGIARDAAGRGLSVYLAEQNDLASGTSSGSTKLIHGGLRYLEHFEFRLVRESLIEREILWALAPHIIRPLRFVLPHHADLRPAWMLRLGLFLYDHIGGRKKLPPTRTIDMTKDAIAEDLKSDYRRAFEYSDCWVEDSRLVILNARDAANRGATIEPRTEVVRAERHEAHWDLQVRNTQTGETRIVSSKFLINAAGPWIDEVRQRIFGDNTESRVRLVQGSHIVVKRLFDDDRCFIFQNSDGRIIFAIPYEHEFTLIGTTDREFTGDPDSIETSEDEVNYLCQIVNEYFRTSVSPQDVVWNYSAVRPLYDDGASKAQEITRDYVLDYDGNAHQAGLLNIFGGKLTTYRRLAENALEEIKPKFPDLEGSWTSHSPLPGGNFPVEESDALIESTEKEYPFLDRRDALRLVHTYGTELNDILQNASNWEDLGKHFGAGLTEAEVKYLQRNEWALTAEDILWRRTKLGLRFSHEEENGLSEWLRDSSHAIVQAPKASATRVL